MILFKDRQQPIPGYSDDRPPLGRLQQLVDQTKAPTSISSPTDYNFIELVKLGPLMQRAAEYLPSHDLSDKFLELTKQRSNEVVRAFQGAQLPGMLAAYHAEALLQGLHLCRFWTGSHLRGFEISYERVGQNLGVHVTTRRLTGKQPVLKFQQLAMEEHGQKRYYLEYASSHHIGRSTELIDQLKELTAARQDDKLRQQARQQVASSNY